MRFQSETPFSNFSGVGCQPCAFLPILHKLTLNPPVAAEGSSRSLFYLQTLRKRRGIPANGRSYCSLPEE